MILKLCSQYICVQAMWLILQQDTADDFVVATGETHTVREFVEKSFGLIDVKIR